MKCDSKFTMSCLVIVAGVWNFSALTDSFGRSSGILLFSERVRSGSAPIKASQGRDKGPVVVFGQSASVLKN